MNLIKPNQLLFLNKFADCLFPETHSIYFRKDNFYSMASNKGLEIITASVIGEEVISHSSFARFEYNAFYELQKKNPICSNIDGFSCSLDFREKFEYCVSVSN